jgi:hypothetical protein
MRGDVGSVDAVPAFDEDGQSLMLDVWGWEKGCLKITACVTDTDKNVQEGVKILSAGLDILSFISFLFRQLDKAVYVKV